MSGGIRPEQTPVKHMRHPGQRMPVAEIGGGKCPLNRLKMNPLLYLIIFSDVSVIVKIDKVIARYATKNDQQTQNQQYNDKISFFPHWNQLRDHST